MDTIIERASGDSSASAITAIVAVLAIAFVVGLALYVLQIFPFAGQQTNQPGININVEGALPTDRGNGSY